MTTEQTTNEASSGGSELNAELCLTDKQIEIIASEIVRAIDEAKPMQWSTRDSWAGRQIYHKETDATYKQRAVREILRGMRHNAKLTGRGPEY